MALLINVRDYISTALLITKREEKINAFHLQIFGCFKVTVATDARYIIHIHTLQQRIRVPDAIRLRGE